MTGERTPDHTRPSDPGSSDNEISLREHMQRQIEVLTESGERALNAALDADHRLNTEQDRRYEQRFAAQENATALALARVDKEFHEHLAQVRAETKAALDAADKAITKQEAATEKRFESVNEFRAQLADQATKFMPRLEAEQRIGQTSEKLSSFESRHNQDMRAISSRLDLTQGRSTGLDKAWAYIVAAVGVVGGIIAIVIATHP